MHSQASISKNVTHRPPGNSAAALTQWYRVGCWALQPCMAPPGLLHGEACQSLPLHQLQVRLFQGCESVAAAENSQVLYSEVGVMQHLLPEELQTSLGSVCGCQIQRMHLLTGLVGLCFCQCSRIHLRSTTARTLAHYLHPSLAATLSATVWTVLPGLAASLASRPGMWHLAKRTVSLLMKR